MLFILFSLFTEQTAKIQLFFDSGKKKFAVFFWGGKETEGKETEDKETEDKETGDKETEDKETEDKETGDKETGDKETGDKEIRQFLTLNS